MACLFNEQYLIFFQIYLFYVICMTVFSTSISVYHVGAVPTVVKRGHQIPLELGL